MEIFLSEAEFAARYLNGARRTAQRWRVTGEGPKFVRLGPRRIVYREKDCEEWVEAHTFRSRTDELAQR
ncbi:MAG: helix-turn-helix transcriptional regulator [Rhodopila sp.]